MLQTSPIYVYKTVELVITWSLRLGLFPLNGNAATCAYSQSLTPLPPLFLAWGSDKIHSTENMGKVFASAVFYIYDLIDKNAITYK